MFARDLLRGSAPFRSRRVSYGHYRAPLSCESLEARLVLATVYWAVDASGYWDVAGNWSTGSVPLPGDDVVIDRPAGDFTVTHRTGISDVRSVISSEQLELAGGTLDVDDSVRVSNEFRLNGGTLKNATVLPGDQGQGILVTANGNNRLDGVICDADVSLDTTAFASLHIANGLTLNGTLNMGGDRSHLSFDGTQSLLGSGQLVITPGGFGDHAVQLAGGSTLTVGSQFTIRGGQGLIYRGGTDPATLINQGIIQADAPNYAITVSTDHFSNSGAAESNNASTLNLASATWVSSGTLDTNGATLSLSGAWQNTGVMNAIDGIVNLGGTFTLADLGTFHRTGGTVNLTGTLDNRSTTLALNAATGSWHLNGGTIWGGSVTGDDGAHLIAMAHTANRLDGVIVDADVSLDATAFASLQIANGLTLNGTLNMGGDRSHLSFDGTQSLLGSGQLVITPGGFGDHAVQLAGGSTLTVGPQFTIRGGQGLIYRGGTDPATLINQGTIQADAPNYAITVSTDHFSNTGTVESSNASTLNLASATWVSSGTLDTHGGTLTLSGDWQNTGVMTATDGIVNLGGTFTLADLGTFHRTGGTVNLTGTLDNRSTTLALNATTGSWHLNGGTIWGGTVTGADGAHLIATSHTANRLDGVIVDTDVSLDTTAFASLRITNGLTLNGTLHMGGDRSHLSFDGTQSLLGSGQLVITPGGFGDHAVQLAGGSTLTVGPQFTIRGGQGLIYRGGTDPATLINQGTIQADAPNYAITVSTDHFSNTGTVESSNASTLNLASATWVSSGTLDTNGATLSLSGAWQNTGVMNAIDGIVNLGGTFTLADLGTFHRTGGTVNLTGTLDNRSTTLALNATTGSWHLNGGTIWGGTVTGADGAHLIATSHTANRLDGVIVDTDVSLDTTAFASLHIANGLTLNGTLNMGGDRSHLSFDGTQSLLGSGQLVITPGGFGDHAVQLAGGSTLTVGSQFTIRGGQGLIYRGGTDPATLINQGIIQADAPNYAITVSTDHLSNSGAAESNNASTLNLASATWVSSGTLDTNGATLSLSGAWQNTGVMTATDGIVNLGGTFTLADLGTFHRTGGTVNLTGTLDNRSTTLALNATTGSWHLNGGTIWGGTVTGADGAHLIATSHTANLLDGVIVDTDVSLDTTAFASLRITNGLTLNGTMHMGGDRSHLSFDGTQSLLGSGQLVITPGGFGDHAVQLAGGSTLTVGSQFTIRGGQGLIYRGGTDPATLINQGTIQADAPNYAITVSTDHFSNTGTVESSNASTLNLASATWVSSGTLDTNGATLTLSGDWQNTGVMTATDGIVNLGGTFTLADLGTFHRTGGTVNLTGTLDNRSTTLALNAATDSWHLNGGTIWGGTVTGADGAHLIATSHTANLLDGVIVDTDVSLDTTAFASLRVTNGLTLNGTLHMGGDRSHLSFDGTQSLLGSGQLVITPGGFGDHAVQLAGGSTLTMGPQFTIRGGQGLIYRGGTDPATLINQGTIQADAPNYAITVSTDHFSNSGAAESSNASTLNLASATWVSSGTLDTHGGTLTLSGDWQNTGVMTATDGIVNLGGTFTLADLGTFHRTGGTVNLTGTLDNRSTTLALNATTGSWQLNGGTIWGGTVTGADGAHLIATSHTANLLDGVICHADVSLDSTSFAQLHIANGLTLNGTMHVGRDRAHLSFDGTQSLLGSGQIAIAADGFGAHAVQLAGGSTLTVGPQFTIRGGYGTFLRGGTDPATLINQGTIQADAPNYAITVSTDHFSSPGILRAAGGVMDIDPSLQVMAPGILTGSPDGTITFQNHLTASTTNKDRFVPSGLVRLDGSGTVVNPQQLEVMSEDLGPETDGFRRNFAYGTLSLANNTYVQLVDQYDNTAGTGAEVLYTTSLIVPTGTTLDLNNFQCYARNVQLAGTVTNGTVTQLPDSGSILPAVATPGSITVPGELDEWSFFGRGGRTVTAVIHPGNVGATPPAPPYLGWAAVELVDANDNILATGSSSFSGEVVVVTAPVLPADGTYRVKVRAADGHLASTGNYMITVWDSTPKFDGLQFNQATSGRIENPYRVDHWNFAALAGQQVRFNLTGTTGPSLVFDLTGPQNWVGFSDLPGNSDLITLPHSGNYTLTARSTGALQDASYSFQLNETTQTDLVLGTPYPGNFAGSDQAQLFRFQLPSSSPLLVALDDLAASDQTGLYLKHGAPPTRSDYAYRSATGADQQLLVSMASAGTWYALVYGDYIPAPSTYSLLASAVSVLLTDLAPDRAGTNADATLTLRGAGLTAGTTVALVNAGSTVYPATAVSYDTFTQLTATFTAGAVPAGVYTVRVEDPGGTTAELPGAFEMLVGGEAILETNVIVPGAVGYHGLATIYVEYANTGDLAMPAPLLSLQPTQNGRSAALLTLDPSRLTGGFWTSAIPEGFSNTAQFLASGQTPGMLQPGESHRVPVYWAGWQQPWDPAYSPILFNLGVVQADNTEPLDWAALKNDLRPPSIGAEAWDPIFANLTTQAGNTWGSYVSVLDDNAVHLSRLGEHVTDITELLSFELMQADGLSPSRTLVRAEDISIDTLGLELGFMRFYSTPISQRYAVGPLGRGWAHVWESSLSEATDGTVTITIPGGGRRVFQPDSRGPSYFSQPGDYGQLSRDGGGGFQLLETNGVKRTWQADGTLDYVEDTNGNRITASYTGSLLTSLTHSDGRALQIDYNTAGRIERITDPFARETTFTYDPTGEHLLSVHDPLQKSVHYEYVAGTGPSAHALSQVTDADGTHAYFSYDAAGRLEQTSRDADAEVRHYTYDTAGGIHITNALGASIFLGINHKGMVVKAEDSRNEATHYGYDRDYNLTSLTDPAGRTYQYSYDNAGNLLNETDPLGHVTSYGYDGPYDRLTDVTDANGNTTNYAYDSQGNRQYVTHADGSRFSWVYDAQGIPSSWTNARSQTLNYTYDSWGQLTAIDYPDSSRTDYGYDARGNLISATNAAGTVSQEFDLLDRLTQITYPGGRWLRFTYDDAGKRLTSLDHTGYHVGYAYDDAGRLERLSDTAGATIVQITYDAAGHLVRKDYGHGGYTVYTYDGDERLLTQQDRAPDGSLLDSLEFDYDSRSRRTALRNDDGEWSYEYDDVGQLVRAVFNSSNPGIASQDLAYSYDGVGNRIRSGINGSTIDYTTNVLNQYTQIGDNTYDYDLCGNLIQESGPVGTVQYSFDPLNRLTSVMSGTDVWQYTYDALGTRITANELGVTSHYLVDPVGLGNIVGQFDSAGNAVGHWDYEYGLVSRTLSSGDRAYYAFGEAGNTTQLVADSGTILNSYRWLPFGEVLASATTVVDPFQFNGQFGVTQESSGLISMRARSYDPAAGRFISRDPIGILGGINLYTFAGNSPVSAVDPSGLCEAFTTCMKSALSANSIDGEAWAERQEKGKAGKQKALRDCWKASEEAGKMAMGTLTGGKPDISGAAEIAGDLAGCAETIDPPPPPAPAGPPGVPAQATDPNEKTGPEGFGQPSFVNDLFPIAYRVDFENDDNATAPAQYVDITDQLSSDLDWSTLQLTEVGFGDTLLDVPAGSQHFQTTVPMTWNDRTFEVQIQIGIDLASGLLRAQYFSIDPVTGLPPDVLTGFLPPEDGTGRGQGYFNYLVRPKTGRPSGTEIRNVAIIQFDFGEIIATNQVDPHDPSQGTDPDREALVTIDSAGPASNVQPLAPASPASFNVAWDGADDVGGSGIASFDIFVSTDGGPFVLWLDDTQDLSQQFNGGLGRTYAFYSIATDNVGHVEEAPTTPDAVTFTTLYPGDFNGDGRFDCTDINLLVAAIASGSGHLGFDLNGDQSLTLADVDAWLALAGAANLPTGAPYLPGDANLDGVVDGSDFNVWNSQKFTSNPAWCAGDFNADGVIDGSDFNIWNTHKFEGSLGTIGDFNGDGLFDTADINILIAAVADGLPFPRFDLNGDSLVDLQDVHTWLAIAGAHNLPSGNPYLPGDANLDGLVDGSDFNTWNAHKFTSLAAWNGGDFNADGIIDGSDFNTWNTYKFQNAGFVGHVTKDARGDQGQRTPDRPRSDEAVPTVFAGWNRDATSLTPHPTSTSDGFTAWDDAFDTRSREDVLERNSDAGQTGERVLDDVFASLTTET